MTEPTDWVGGQLTSQCVPPDEHPWIEEFGCTRRYRAFRDGVRKHYRDHRRLSLVDSEFNPGGGWVSRLCFEPAIGHVVLQEMVAHSKLRVLLHHVPLSVETDGDLVIAVELLDVRSGQRALIRPKFVLDATETGELLPLSGTEYVVGAEGKSETGEPNALDDPHEDDNVQGLTWCAVLGYDEGGDHTIEKPAQYDFWRSYKPSNWPCELLSFKMLHVQRGDVIDFPLFGKDDTDWFNMFSYRQIVDPRVCLDQREPATVMNWPMNDYYVGTVLDVPEEVAKSRLQDARELTLSMLYWLQTEAGYPGLRLRPDLTGTEDGLAKAPYIRESRRMRAMHTVREQDVAAYTNTGRDRAPEVGDSVGVGAYRIDLHPSTNGRGTIDTSSLPFQIPLGSLVPVRMRNLLPACKNIGTTHITNGCYRLHPVEWNIGESAGLLAAFCLREGMEPQQISSNPVALMHFQILLVSQGIEIEWPKVELRAL